MNDKKETIVVRKVRAIRQSPQEDFGPETKEEPFTIPPAKEIIRSSRRDLEEMSMLDMFAMVVSPGVAKRLETPHLVATESYRIAEQMVITSAYYKKMAEK